jgi:hypothetical protein
VARLGPPADRVEIGAVIAEIAVDAVIHQALKRLVHHVGRAEVHVRDPHRDAVLGRDAATCLHPVPLAAMGAPPLDNFVEIHVIPLRLPAG